MFAFVLFALVFSVLSCLFSGRGGSFCASAVSRRRSGRPVPVWLVVFGFVLLLLPPVVGVAFCVVA